jgi:hypothetical protein
MSITAEQLAEIKASLLADAKAAAVAAAKAEHQAAAAAAAAAQFPAAPATTTQITMFAVRSPDGCPRLRLACRGGPTGRGRFLNKSAQAPSSTNTTFTTSTPEDRWQAFAQHRNAGLSIPPLAAIPSDVASFILDALDPNTPLGKAVQQRAILPPAQIVCIYYSAQCASLSNQRYGEALGTGRIILKDLSVTDPASSEGDPQNHPDVIRHLLRHTGGAKGLALLDSKGQTATVRAALVKAGLNPASVIVRPGVSGHVVGIRSSLSEEEQMSPNLPDSCQLTSVDVVVTMPADELARAYVCLARESRLVLVSEKNKYRIDYGYPVTQFQAGSIEIEIEIGTPERTRAWTLGAVGWASRMLSARIRTRPPYAPLPQAGSSSKAKTRGTSGAVAGLTSTTFDETAETDKTLLVRAYGCAPTSKTMQITDVQAGLAKSVIHTMLASKPRAPRPLPTQTTSKATRPPTLRHSAPH